MQLKLHQKQSNLKALPCLVAVRGSLINKPQVQVFSIFRACLIFNCCLRSGSNRRAEQLGKQTTRRSSDSNRKHKRVQWVPEWLCACVCVCVCPSTMVFSMSPDADPPSPSHFAVCTLQLSGNCIVNARCEMANNLIWPPKLCPVALEASRRPEQHCQHRLLVVRLFRPCSSFVIDAQIKNNDKQVRQTCKDRTGNTLLKCPLPSSWLKTGTKVWIFTEQLGWKKDVQT